MKNEGMKKKVADILKDKILLLFVAAGWVIIIYVAFTFILAYLYRTEWIASVSGDDLRLGDTVEVLKDDGTYIKTIHCIRKSDSIKFTGEYCQYVYTIYGPGIEFHPVVKFRRECSNAGHHTFSVRFDIYRNGDQWDATVTDGGYTVNFEDIEKNGICIELCDV